MTSFKEYVSKYRDSVYSKIMEYLPLKEPEAHYRMVRDYSERMGSYRRAGFILLTGEMFGEKPENLFLPAAAMQMSEDWILIHDDIEDNSESRRGKPALHKIHGNELAINAGDAVHISMWKALKDYMVSAAGQRGSRLFDTFYDMLERTVEGQYLETNFILNSKSLSKASEKLYLDIVSSKTCYYTVYGPMQLGAIAAGASDAKLHALREIGYPAGVAFQIIDDVLDMTADEKVFGKQRYGDLYEGKLTLIMLHAYESSSDSEKKETDRIFSKQRQQKTPEEISFLAGIAEKYGSVEYARGRAKMYADKAKEAVKQFSGEIPSNSYRDILLSSIEEMYRREK